MIIITGAAGFIGSALTTYLNEKGHKNLILVDDFSRLDKASNWQNQTYIARVARHHFIHWLKRNQNDVSFIFHLGARTDTTEKDQAIFDELNLNYSKSVWQICTEAKIPLIYASSAATYGLGELGYQDRHDIVSDLKPLNPYGVSKNDFDKWVLEQEKKPPFWAGLKFFNVYGYPEAHKGRMASVIFHTVQQIRKTGGMKLFRSHKEGIENGHQSRDFVYVKDVVKVCYFLFQQRPESALYNLGTGTARTFLDLASHTFRAMNLEPNISFVDTPVDIRDTYQYFTEADMKKLRKVGYEADFYSLEQGIEEYVKQYLAD